MSTSIYRVELKDLAWGNEFAQWLDDNTCHDGDIMYISRVEFESSLKEAGAKFRKEHKDQIESIRKAIKASKYGEGIDVWISW